MCCSEDISRGCCRTNPKIGSCFDVVVSGLSNALPEWRRCVFSLRFGPQPGLFHSFSFAFPVDSSDTVSSVLFPEEAIWLMHWFQGNISQWNDWFCHRSHNKGRRFSVFCHFGCLRCWCWYSWVAFLLLGSEFVWPLILLLFSYQHYFWWLHTSLSCVWVDGIDCGCGWLFAVVTCRLGFFRVLLVACCVTVFICSSSGDFKPFRSSSFPRCNTNCS